MNIGKQLYDLQQIDFDLAEKEEKLKEVESLLSDNEALSQAQAELTEKRSHLTELEKKQKASEWAIDDLQAKINPLQDKLFACATKNPKELGSMQQQVKHFKDQVREEEDKVLEMMSQVEGLQKEIALMSSNVKRLEEEWQQRQKQLLVEKASLTTVLDILKGKRSELIAIIDPIYLGLYEALRVKRQGQAIARIEQGRCLGCRITLSVSELQQARSGELAQCGSCERILYLG